MPKPATGMLVYGPGSTLIANPHRRTEIAAVLEKYSKQRKNITTLGVVLSLTLLLVAAFSLTHFPIVLGVSLALIPVVLIVMTLRKLSTYAAEYSALTSADLARRIDPSAPINITHTHQTVWESLTPEPESTNS